MRTMNTYEIFAPNTSSTAYKPSHIIQAASFAIIDGVYVFYDADLVTILHAVAITPGLFVRTAKG